MIKRYNEFVSGKVNEDVEMRDPMIEEPIANTETSEVEENIDLVSGENVEKTEENIDLISGDDKEYSEFADYMSNKSSEEVMRSVSDGSVVSNSSNVSDVSLISNTSEQSSVGQVSIKKQKRKYVRKKVIT